MLSQDPTNSFAQYGLAMEYAKSGAYDDAVAEFRRLIERDQTYVAAYFHSGQALEKLGRLNEAREVYQKGIDASARKGDLHTESEIRAALDLLPQ